jgi:hypothetical protein
VFPIMWFDVFLLVVLADSSCISCAAVMIVYGVSSFLYRVHGVYVLLPSVSNIRLCASMYASFICYLSLLISYMWYIPSVCLFLCSAPVMWKIV